MHIKTIKCIVFAILLITIPIYTQDTEIIQDNDDLIPPDHSIQGYPGLDAINTSSFVSKWNTSKSGTSASDQITLPIYSGGNYDFEVDWGDSIVETITSYTQATHTYASEGVYDVIINGNLVGWRFNGGGDRYKIIEISQWGNINFGNLGLYFFGAGNLVITATDGPDLTGTTNLNYAFADCSSLETIGNWDVSSVTNMNYMFRSASSFNQSIGNWDVSRVTDMSYMFWYASSFNQPLNNWNVSSVTDMSWMFTKVTSFNQPIGDWDVSNVTDMTYMFIAASSFNQPLNNWDVSGVITMYGMFMSAVSFNQSIGDWDVSSVSSMGWMFYNATSFNQPIGNWDVSSVSTMYNMFYKATSFNQPIGDWDVSLVTIMYNMFYEATSFNQPIGDWDITGVTSMVDMFYNSRLSYQNYDNLLIGWSSLTTLRPNIIFNGGNSEYTSRAIDARDYLVNTYGWTISDGGFVSLTYPDISNPDDISYEQSSTGNIIQWIVGDENPGTFNITRNGHLLEEDIWTNGTITKDIDDLVSGIYEFTIYVYDADGNMVFDVVEVTVVDTTPPEISYPDNIEYEYDTTGNMIEWTVGDINIWTYNVTKDRVLYTEDIWTNGTISLDIDGMDVGLYIFTIWVYDAYDNVVFDNVAVNVFLNETNTITETITETVTDTEAILSTLTEYITYFNTSDISELTDTTDAPIFFTFVIMGLAVFILRRRK